MLILFSSVVTMRPVCPNYVLFHLVQGTLVLCIVRVLPNKGSSVITDGILAILNEGALYSPAQQDIPTIYHPESGFYAHVAPPL